MSKKEKFVPSNLSSNKYYNQQKSMNKILENSMFNLTTQLNNESLALKKQTKFKRNDIPKKSLFHKPSNNINLQYNMNEHSITRNQKKNLTVDKNAKKYNKDFSTLDLSVNKITNTNEMNKNMWNIKKNSFLTENTTKNLFSNRKNHKIGNK